MPALKAVQLSVTCNSHDKGRSLGPGPSFYGPAPSSQPCLLRPVLPTAKLGHSSCWQLPHGGPQQLLAAALSWPWQAACPVDWFEDAQWVSPHLRDLPSVQCASQSCIINDAAASHVDDAGALLDLAERIVVEHVL